MADRAFATFALKSLDEERREFSGLATSPVPDRVLDIIEPLGAKYQNPTVLLRAHDHTMPIGSVHFDRPTKTGVGFRAKIPKIEEPGLLKDRVDMAWGEVKHGLIRAVSVGFRPIETPEPLKSGGLRYPKVEIFELSTVAVPSQALATIDAVKAIDAAVRSGEPPASDAEALWAKIAGVGLAKLNEFDAGAEYKDLGPTFGTIASTAHSAQAMIKALCAHVEGLERRLDEPALAYRGGYQRAQAYRRGEAVTFKGSLFIALTAVPEGEEPGESKSWQLAVRAGRDGKDAA